MPTLRPRKRNAGAPSAAATTPLPPAPTVAATTHSASSATSTTISSSTTVTWKKRAAREDATQLLPLDDMSLSDEERPFIDDGPAPEDVEALPKLGWAQRNGQWIAYALASGACAAFNGVFAKLTTTELTTTFSMAIARVLGLQNVEKVIEVIVRCIFFGLNLVFNGVMWTLFTTALARGNSTTQVSIMNTSCNFVITAVLGFAIFSEALPPLWWLGAAMLVAGNVIVGRKDEGVASSESESEGHQEEGEEHHPQEHQQQEEGVDMAVELESVKDEDLVDLGDVLDEGRDR
ncbi:hypothetical protein BT67DRAFT_442011 [Trichocladium antarcticum]|uniref:Transmembrane protein 42 n=1 Tax=Trichocladium antarcticum TaxID=1450529 RepID=A0AAN6ZDB1_9PEZI|nr:hypothetical protein BT67DRAFT_442011 [Trichocladium antarcticum]